jgi:hypothetical protein
MQLPGAWLVRDHRAPQRCPLPCRLLWLHCVRRRVAAAVPKQFFVVGPSLAPGSNMADKGAAQRLSVREARCSVRGGTELGMAAITRQRWSCGCIWGPGGCRDAYGAERNGPRRQRHRGRLRHAARTAPMAQTADWLSAELSSGTGRAQPTSIPSRARAPLPRRRLCGSHQACVEHDVT